MYIIEVDILYIGLARYLSIVIVAGERGPTAIVAGRFRVRVLDFAALSENRSS